MSVLRIYILYAISNDMHYSSNVDVYLCLLYTEDDWLIEGTVVVVIVWQLDLQLHVQSVHITTKVVSSNTVHGEVYSTQHYHVMKCVSDMRQVDGFLRVLRFPPPIKLTPWYSWNIVESGVKHHQTNKTNQGMNAN